jgi:uncharacterized protein YndB with AHSA1/START domain
LHLEVSRVVKAQPERVFAAYTDFEAMPKWSKRLTAVRVTRREGDTVYLESEGVSSRGRPNTRVGVLKLLPPEKVESESETRFTRSRRTVAFEALPDGTGTKVTATLDVEVKGLWGVLLSPGVKKDVAESSATEELASFAGFVEGAQA